MTKRHALFNNPQVLEETTSIASLSDAQEIEEARLNQKLEQWVRKNQNRIIAFVGAFGSGKSVVLEHLAHSDSKKKSSRYHWFQFDVWRYADRQQIWDGFAIEVSSAIGKSSSKPRQPEDIADKIEGEQVENWAFKLSTFVQGHFRLTFLIVFLVWIVASWVLWYLLTPPEGELAIFLRALLKYGAPMLFLVLALVGVSSIVPKPKRPLRRVFELEKELASAMRMLDKPFIVVVEDVDRSSQDGMVFLEALRNFLKKEENTFNHPVIVIAPQDKTHFDVVNNGGADGFERTLKVYDTVMYYGASSLQMADMLGLLNEAQVRKDVAARFRDTVTGLVSQYRGQVKMRLLKFILREVAEFVDAYPAANPSVAFILILSRYIRIVPSKYDKVVVEANTLLRRANDIWTTSMNRTPVATFAEALAAIHTGAQDAHKLRLEFVSGQSEEITTEPVHSGGGRLDKVIIKLEAKYKILL